MTKSNGIERAEGGEDRYEVLLFSVSSSESIFTVELTTYRRAFSKFRSSRLPIWPKRLPAKITGFRLFLTFLGVRLFPAMRRGRVPSRS